MAAVRGVSVQAGNSGRNRMFVALQEAHRIYGEWMIFPGPHFVDRREVSVGDIARLADPMHPWYIYADVIITNIRDSGALDAVLHHAEGTEEAVKAPYGHRSEEPVVIEVVVPLEDHVIPVSSVNYM